LYSSPVQQSRTLLLQDATLVATMDDVRREIVGGSVLLRGREIAAVGRRKRLRPAPTKSSTAAARSCCPVLVNTHHHFFQTLTRAVPAAQDVALFGWLRVLYPMWQRLTPEMLRVSATTALAELALSGCTTTSDHLYLYPNGGRLDDTIEAAREVGLRFHACRGAMTVGESQGGLPPDALVEREDDALRDMRRVVEAYHDPSPLSMLRVACAPCSPFSVSQDFMRESAALARAYGVGLHTHLAENDDDVAYTRERFGCTPAEYAHDAGWTGSEVWHAHCVKLDDGGIRLFAETQTGVAHCPTSNMRLASGIAPVRRMRDAGVTWASAWTDRPRTTASHPARRGSSGAAAARASSSHAGAVDAAEALWIATRGGARVLGRQDIGHIAPGMAADVVAFDLDDLAYAGALHDPLAALVFCAPSRAWLSIVDGRVVVRDGRVTTVDTGPLVERHNLLARELLR
jgi:cytosine/adenosine deaminase-related metal-dependent hydrolase